MKDKVAIVTGAGTGIGQGIAIELGRRGAAVVVHYHTSETGAHKTAQEIEKAGGQALIVQADLRQVSECKRVIDEGVKAFGRLDILINNSGVTTQAGILDVTEETWDLTVEIALKAAFFCAQAAARQMIAQGGGGKIVHIGSVHGNLSLPGFAAYAAAKGGLHNLTRQMAFELAPHHINVNCIAPGVIEVERYLTFMPHYRREKWSQKVPWGRVGFPQDVANLAAFLCSDEADYITGQVICIDGGQTTSLQLDRS